MKTSYLPIVCTVGLASLGIGAGPAFAGSTAADANGKHAAAAPQEPIGFVAGGVVGAFAAGPLGAVVGAGVGTWLGNRVHRAGDAKRDEAEIAALGSQRAALEARDAALLQDQNRLTESNRALTVQVRQLSDSVKAVQTAKQDPAEALDGLQGDVLFRTGSAEIAPDLAHQIQTLAQAMTKSPELRIRVDGYADPRGPAKANLELSEARANAVRDLLVASGISDEALEVNAFGKTLSVADDEDGYALERRVRLTLQVAGSPQLGNTATGADAGPGAAAGADVGAAAAATTTAASGGSGR
jgi:outer membrane protein OmpA-like peptidoglycan-associated protein